QGEGATAPTEVLAPTHYTFAGWDKAFSEVTDDTVVTAQYREDAKHTVTFKGYNGEVLNTQSVYDGEAATAPTTVPVPNPTHIRFVRWDTDFARITSDLTVNAVFEEDAKYTVTFVGYTADGVLGTLKTEMVYTGEGATAPDVPARAGYVFSRWDKAFDNITEATTVTALYIQKYTVTVSGGNASVTDAVAGTTVTLTATTPAGKAFVRWTVTAGGVTLADATAATTTFVMPEGNVEVTAEFVNVWTVTFVVDGNTVKTQTVREGESATAPTDEEIADYLPAHVESFTWNKSFTNIRSDLTVTAVFVFENQHIVTFKGYNGEVLDTQAVYDGEAATAPTTVPVPDPTHIRFVRWDTDFTNVTSNLTVNAVFEEDAKYTVTFVGYTAEGVLGTLKTETVYVGEGATAPDVPARDGYVFVRWDKAFESITENTTVTAVYSQKYTVTVSGGNASVTEAVAGTTVTLTATIPAGKAFVRWTVTAGGVTLADATATTTTFVMPEGNVEITAEYVNVWTVTFVVDGNTVKTETVREGESATAPTESEMADYLPAHVASVAWDKSFTNVTSNLTVTAVLTYETPHTVIFKGYNGEVLDTQSVYDGEAATAPTNVPVPDPTHIRFVRWDKAFTNVTSDLTVNAVFEEDAKYTVTFVGYTAEGVLGTLKTETVYVGEGATAPDVPARDGYVFVRWDKAFDNITENTTVTAVYSQKYTVTVTGGNASVTDAVAGTTVTLTAAPPAGKVFVKWTVTAGGVTLADATAATTTFVMPEGNVEVTAEYDTLKHTVIFHTLGGTEIPAVSVSDGDTVAEPTAPIRDGFTFLYWTLASGERYDFSTPVTADITLVAVYESTGEIPAPTITNVYLDPGYLELWVGLNPAPQLNICFDNSAGDQRLDFPIAGMTFEAHTTDDRVVTVSNDGTVTAVGLGTAKVYIIFTSDGTVTSGTDTITIQNGDVLAAIEVKVVEKPAYLQAAEADPENQQITLGSSSTNRINVSDFTGIPTGAYGSANIALWYDGAQAVFTMTADDNLMYDFAKWNAWLDEYGIPVTLMVPMRTYADSANKWLYETAYGNYVQSHGFYHRSSATYKSGDYTTAQAWMDFYLPVLYFRDFGMDYPLT
ncbi:MAG: InlB B-repeat-containing protein, partial [Eubacteriales bacterium]